MGLKNRLGRWAALSIILGMPWLLATQAAAQSARELQQEMQEIKEQMQQLNNKLQEAEKNLQEARKEQDWNNEDIEELSQRVTETEKHAAADKVELGIELEPRLWSIHLQDMRTAFPVLQDSFPAIEDFHETTGAGFTAPQVQSLLSGGFTAPQIQGLLPGIDQQTAQRLADLENPPAADVDNHAVRTLKFRLRMDAEYNEHLRFAGRLAAYKVFGDSVGININKGGFQDISFDGTTASNPHGDEIRLERAYFVYQDDWGDVPWSFSLGRRPSTEGPPLELKKNLPAVGGSPHAHLINWQFDGGSLNFNLEEVVGIPGFDIKFCYGSGFENQYGTASAFVAEPATEDVDFFGVIGTLYENYLPELDTELAVSYNYAYAPNITDGFTGLTVFPFNVTKENDQYFFQANDLGAVSRFEASSKIGDWHALSLLSRANTLD
ncbi:MAG: DUF3373 family protein, partial [Desulfohalobiaceae bacterium]|nr:DUF3373 family protein [Desulfohalobiaceae bacterium]